MPHLAPCRGKSSDCDGREDASDSGASGRVRVIVLAYWSRSNVTTRPAERSCGAIRRKMDERPLGVLGHALAARAFSPARAVSSPSKWDAVPVHDGASPMSLRNVRAMGESSSMDSLAAWRLRL